MFKKKRILLFIFSFISLTGIFILCINNVSIAQSKKNSDLNKISFNKIKEAEACINNFNLPISKAGLVDPTYNENSNIQTLLSKTGDGINSIILSGKIIDNKSKYSEVGFDYRQRGEIKWKEWTKKGLFTSGEFNYTLKISLLGERYEFKAKAKDSSGWSYGSILLTSDTGLFSINDYLGGYRIANTPILPIPFEHQEETYTCEAASTRMAINYLGRPCTEWDILSRTGRVGPGGDPNQNFVEGYGVHPGPVTRAVNGMNGNYRFGLIGWEWKGSINDLYARCAAGGVTIIWLNQTFSGGYHEHAVVIMGFRNGNIVYMDPWYGGIEEPVWTFMNKWWGWGVAIDHYTWQFVGQAADKDLTKLSPGEEFNVSLTVRNVSNFVWYRNGNNPVRVGTTHSWDRTSIFATSSWLGPNRPVGISQGTDQVAPGQTVTFSWNMKAPNTYGVYREYFSFLAEGRTWMNDPGVNYYINVNPYSWQFISQTADKDLAKLQPGDEATITLTAKNNGNAIWYRDGPNQVRVGTTHPQDRSSAFANGTWLGPNRPVGLPAGTDSVVPGETATFSWTYTAPARPGVYREGFSLLAEGATWMNDPGVNYYTVVHPDIYSWQFISQTADKDLAKLKPGDQAEITLTAKNTGNVTWSRQGNNPVRVGTTNPRDRSSAFANGTWLGTNRPVGLSEGTDSVAPGETATFSWTYTAPSRAGTYREYFSLLAEGITWMNDPGVNYYTVVH